MSERNNSPAGDGGSRTKSSPHRGVKCQTCGQNLTPDAWCYMHMGKSPSLWTAKQAAAESGCSRFAMGLAMSRWFAKRYLRDSKVTVYCVWPPPYNAFLKSQSPERLHKLWTEQHVRREAKHLARELHAELSEHTRLHRTEDRRHRTP